MTDFIREREIFAECVEQPTSERPAFVQSACGGNSELEQRILRLLAAHEIALVSFSLKTNSDPILLAEPLREIGPYRLLQTLGEGGMGIVYEAEQTEPIHRRVALKIIKQGMDTAQVVARFDAERQALAVMDHPNIARVLDAGVAPTGQPYFVMELVNGVPLTQYCDRQRLTTRQRLELVIPLCKAVQHAHQKGVIHRDLKPSNVLITTHDGQPVPKVIDFGIAKALGQPLTKMTLITLHGQPMGTPAYMSPEQADSSGIDIDTRSDIYSLGVMLYELLVGAVPRNPEDTGIQQYIAELVRGETDPPTPSTMLAKSGEQGQKVASLRATDLTTLRRELKGDLDWIVMKAIENDRSRRYDTANALALEIERYLSDEPILARPPSASYRFQKFVRRNRFAALAGAVALLALVIGTVAFGIGLLKTMQAERQARQETQRALKAEQDAVRRLRDSLLAQARANRRTREPGQRHRTLDLLSRAAAIGPGADLRDEASAAMTLTDLKLISESPLEFRHAPQVVFDHSNSRYVVGFEGGRLEVRSVRENKPLLVLPGFGSNFHFARFSRDGNYLAVKYHGEKPTDNPALRVWNLRSREIVLASAEILHGRALDFDLTSRLFASGTYDGWVHIRELPGGQARMRVRVGSQPVMVRFRPDGGAIAVALENGVIEIRELSGRLVQQLKDTHLVYSIDWSRDGRHLAAGYANQVGSIWDVSLAQKITTLRGHQAEVVDVQFLPTAPILLTYSWDETSRLWDVNTGDELLVVQARAREFSEDGKSLSFVTSRTIGTWEVLHGDLFRTLKGHTGKAPVAIGISRNGRWLASTGVDGTLLWNLESGRTLGSLPSGPAKDVFFEPEQDGLFTCGPKGLLGWTFTIADGRLSRISSSQLFSQPCERANLDVAGKTFAFSQDVVIRVMPRDSPSTLRVIQGFPGLSMVSVSPGGRWIAAGNWRGNQTQVWDTGSGKIVADLLPDTESVNVLFSPIGKWLVTGSSEDYRIWSVDSWKEIARFDRPERFSRLPGIMAFSPDDSLVAATMDQRMIRIFHVETGKLLLTLEPPAPQTFTDLQFTPDGKRLIAATHGNRILIWEFQRVLDQLRIMRMER